MPQRIKVIKTSCRGNKAHGIPNQDWFETVENSDYLLLMVSDGLGSVKYGLKGAGWACSSVRKIVGKSFKDEDVKSWGEKIIAEWYERVRKQGQQPEHFRTTSLFALVHKKKERIFTGQLGDGLIAVKTDNDFYVGSSADKDFINETVCLGSPEGEKFIISDYGYRNNFEILLATDGFSDDLQEGVFPELFTYFKMKYGKINAKIRNILFSREVLKSMKNKYCDDRTIIFAWTGR